MGLHSGLHLEVEGVKGGSKFSSFILAVDRNAEEANSELLRHCVCSGTCLSVCD